MKLSSILIAGVLSSGAMLSGCSKDTQCTTETELENSGHLIDISSFQSMAPEFVDSLNKYPGLQAYKLQHSEDLIRIDCNVYYNDVRMFFATYGLLKQKGSGEVSVVGNNVTDFNLNVNFTPSISGSDAVQRAKKVYHFGLDCITFTLGVTDMQSILNLPDHDYKLAWKVTTENESGFVFVDAHSGDILYKTELWE